MTVGLIGVGWVTVVGLTGLTVLLVVVVDGLTGFRVLLVLVLVTVALVDEIQSVSSEVVGVTVVLLEEWSVVCLTGSLELLTVVETVVLSQWSIGAAPAKVATAVKIAISFNCIFV